MTYHPIDRYVWLNTNDPSLVPIRVDQLDLIRRTYQQYGLEPPDEFPEPETVDGYGLPPDKQKFTRETTPIALVELERAIRHELKPRNKARDLSPVRRELKLIERFWEELDSNKEKYAEEIEWLERCWYHRLFGKHLYIAGKHTYITGAYWYFLNYWMLNGNVLPEYRDRDRRWSIGLKYCELTTETFAVVDPDTKLPIPEPDGSYVMRDTGRRTIMGALFSKARRVGDTSRIESAYTEFGTRTMAAKVGIQGMSDENAETVFQEHMIYPFLRIPVFFKPIWDAAGGLMPKTSILFDDTDSVSEGLHTIIDHATSSDKAAYDGKFLHRLHLDEAGKFSRSDINEVIDVAKFCLALGAGSEIHGLASATTTVDFIEEESAGDNYKKLTDRSHWERRDANGQTNSGLINIFFPASDGLQGYIGPYGESIIDTPTTEQALFIGRKHGAKEFIANKKAEAKRAKDWDGLAIFTRQHPEEFAECFVPPPKAQKFNRQKIEERIEFIKKNPDIQPVRGDFLWMNGPDNKVIWVPSEDGRFYMSRQFLPAETNQIKRQNDTWVCKDPLKFVISVDTIGLSKPEGRKSKGGIVGRWRRDERVDPDSKPNEAVQSDRVFLTYCYRPPSVDEFNEDVLKACVYTGSPCFPERNCANTIQYFRWRGYEGMLLYEIDREGKRLRNEPGWWNGAGKTVEDHILKIAQDINNNINRQYHTDILEELLKFENRKSLTDLDLTSAYLGTLIAETNYYYKLVKSYSSSFDCTGWVPWE